MSENPSPEAGGGGGGRPVSKGMPAWAWVLIGCGGLMVVCFFAAIIAAIAIPSLLGARQGANEAAAGANLRCCATAQVMYHKTDHDGDAKLEYAATLPELFTVGFVDANLAGAHGPLGIPKQGYRFRECQTIGGKPIDLTVDYAMCAVPAAYGKSGLRTFIVSTAGTLWSKDLGPGGTFVDDFPADPWKAGWREAD